MGDEGVWGPRGNKPVTRGAGGIASRGAPLFASATRGPACHPGAPGLFGSVMGLLTVFGAEKAVFQREYGNRMYGLPAYFISRYDGERLAAGLSLRMGTLEGRYWMPVRTAEKWPHASSFASSLAFRRDAGSGPCQANVLHTTCHAEP